MSANFYKDLKRGQDAEALFLTKYGEFLEPLDGKTGDWRIKGTNLKGEQKSDFYSHDRWPNFICEVYRSGKKPGGSFQSMEHGCAYFAYYFVNDDKLYFFSTIQFCARVRSAAKKYKLPLETISNGTYETSYYRIPRAYFEDIMLPFHEVVERKFRLAAARAAKKAAK